MVFEGKFVVLGAMVPGVRQLRARRSIFVAAGTLALAFIMSAAVYAQPSSTGDVREFLRDIAGEWIGVCEQTTDGERADDKYFHAVIRQVDADTFDGQFEYYRFEEGSRSPLPIGDTTVVITVDPDGAAKSEIAGRGTILVYDKPETEQHEMSEVLICAGTSGLQGEGTGKIEVSGIPFGLGKKGKIKTKTTWSLNNDVLTIHQTLKTEFRVLFFKKGFSVVAHYTATRGSDVASLITEKAQVAAGSTAAALKRS